MATHEPLEWYTRNDTIAKLKGRREWTFAWITSGPAGYTRLDVYKTPDCESWHYAINEDYDHHKFMFGSAGLPVTEAQRTALRDMKNDLLKIVDRIVAEIDRLQELNPTTPS